MKARSWCASTALALAASFLPGMPTAAAEPAACLSPDPSKWPAPSRPYFMLVVDNSGSMAATVTTGTNSCGFQHNRIGDARCAVKNLIGAYGGEVNFGLATYAWRESCPAGSYTCSTCDQTTGCFTNASCTAQYTPGDDSFCGPLTTESALGISVHAGGYVAVPLVQDNYWNPPLNTTNFTSLFNLVDNNCGNGEIGSNSNTPLGGTLFTLGQ
jgi:hypothetical protein